MSLGIIVASSNGSVGMEAAIDVLRSGGSAMDAIVVALSLVEANPEDHSVGYSGLPNMLGQVELDASVMEGKGLRAGSVAALQDYQDAAQLARSVMDGLPHVLIVGEGARRLAAETGLEPKDLNSPESLEIWRSRTDELAELGSAQVGLLRPYARPGRPHELRSSVGRRPWHGQLSLPGQDTATSLPASAPPVGRGNTPVALATPRSLAPATTATTAGAPRLAPAVARWPSAVALLIAL